MRLVDCVQTTLPRSHVRRPVAYTLTDKAFALIGGQRCDGCGRRLRPDEGKVCRFCTGAVAQMLEAARKEMEV